jgi:DNA-binding beta-propeller fold protein YncE
MGKTVYGNGKYTYELAEGWAKCTDELTFNDAPGVAIDSQDRVYVFSRGNNIIMIFDRDGNLLRTWGKGYFTNAHGVHVARDDSVFCVQTENHTVSKFTPEGKLLMVLGTPDKPSDTGYIRKGDTLSSIATITGGPPFNRPTNVAVSESGEIYVSDGYGNSRIHKFSPDGKLLFSWGEPGAAPGHFRLPHSVRIDRKNRIWVVDRENNRIQIFDNRGKFLDQLTGLLRPTDLCFDNEDTVYVSELGLTVSIFNLEGKLLARWGSTGLNKQTDLFVAPHGIAVDSKNNLYVGEVANTFAKVDRGTRALHKFIRKT